MKIFKFLFTIIFFLSYPINTLAIIRTPGEEVPSQDEIQQKYEEQKENIEEHKEYYQGLLLNWDLIITNLQKEINRLQTRQEYRKQLYEKVSVRVNNTLDLLDEQGVDTSEIRVLLDKLDQELHDAYQATNDAISHLTTALNYAQQHDIDNMLNELKQANESILESNQHYKNAYSIFVNEIVPLLLELI